MNAHQLDADGVILNTIVVDSLDVLPDLVAAAIGGKIGDRVVGGVVIPALPAAPTVPQSVSMRQARLALLQAGLLATVNSTISGMTGAAGDAARIEWEYSGEVHRNRALVAALGPALGLTDAQLDQLFITANTL